VFFPVVLLYGVGKFLFTPLALSVVFAMLTSYLLSRALVPAMALSLLAETHEENQGSGWWRRFVVGFAEAQLLSNIATFTHGVDPAVVDHYTVQRVINVDARVSGRDLGSVLRPQSLVKSKSFASFHRVQILRYEARAKQCVSRLRLWKEEWFSRSSLYTY